MSLDINLSNIGESLNRKADLDFGNVEIGEQFKQSVENAGVTFVKETYKDGTDWYRVWSDGWIEQGGQLTPVNAGTVVSLLKPYSDTNYSIQATNRDSANRRGAQAWQTSTTQITVRATGGTSESSTPCCWYACGY
jgi:hypothetical protein